MSTPDTKTPDYLKPIETDRRDCGLSKRGVQGLAIARRLIIIGDLTTNDDLTADGSDSQADHHKQEWRVAAVQPDHSALLRCGNEYQLIGLLAVDSVSNVPWVRFAASAEDHQDPMGAPIQDVDSFEIIQAATALAILKGLG